MHNLPKVEACERCLLILACAGSNEPGNACNHGQAVEGLCVCTRNPAGCAVSGNTVFVPPEKYPHNCQPMARTG